MVAAVKQTPHPPRPAHAGRKGPLQEPWGLPCGPQVRLGGHPQTPDLLTCMTSGGGGGEPYPAVCKPQKAKQTVPLRSQAWIRHRSGKRSPISQSLMTAPRAVGTLPWADSRELNVQRRGLPCRPSRQGPECLRDVTFVGQRDSREGLPRHKARRGEDGQAFWNLQCETSPKASSPYPGLCSFPCIAAFVCKARPAPPPPHGPLSPLISWRHSRHPKLGPSQRGLMQPPIN